MPIVVLFNFITTSSKLGWLLYGTAMLLNKAIERAIKHDTGKSIYELQEQTLWERRKEVGGDYETMYFTVNFPTIGRGNQLRERTLSHDEIERITKKALKRFDQSTRNQ
jgi:hypothetical protein